MQEAKTISISLSAEFYDELVRLAKDEGCSVTEICQEAVRQYLATNAVEDVRCQAKSVVANRLTSKDIENTIDTERAKNNVGRKNDEE